MHDSRKGSCKGGEGKEGLVPSGLPGALKYFYYNGSLCGQNTRSAGLSRAQEVSRVTQLQAEAGILGNVWLPKGKDVAINSEVYQPAPPWPSQQRGAHSAATGADGWSSDVTARALAWLNIGGHNRKDKKGRL